MQTANADAVMTHLEAGGTFRDAPVSYATIRKHGERHPDWFAAALPLALANGKARTSAAAKRKGERTHCIKGHEFTPENTIHRVVRKSGWPFRECRTCRREWNRSANVAPEAVAIAVDAIKSGKTITQVTSYKSGRRPLIRYNQLIPALRRDPQLDAAIRAISDRNAIRTRAVLLPALRLPTLSGIIAGEPHPILTTIRAAVSDLLPRHIRDDVIGSLVLDVWEQKLSLEHIATEARRRANRLYYEQKYAVSLDAPAFRDGNTTRGELVSHGLWQ